MDFFVETLKNASLHIHAVWLAIAYVAVILAMAVDFIAGLRKAKIAGKVTTSRALKMTTEKATKYFLPMLCLSCIDVLTSVVLPAPFFTLLMGAFNIFCEWKSVLESTHDKQELREAANTFNVIVKNKDDIAGIIMQAMEMMEKKQAIESNNKNINPQTTEET
ncbi:MAG: phage holin family protein [Muribaculaceae bacterium]|jgi:hypothetical protein|nr:phage holin family protein [Prevotella sp.]MBQ9584366.1 phage holin family protein [Muribaculaceae bacterium]MBR0024217.1 phage holin family protein [Muribaculaceae bacterium]